MMKEYRVEISQIQTTEEIASISMSTLATSETKISAERVTAFLDGSGETWSGLN